MHTIVRAAGEGQWLGIDWAAFVLVFVVTLAAGLAVVSFYATGLRLLAVGAQDDTVDSSGTLVRGERDRPRPAGATAGAYVAFALAAAAVLYGLYLLIPQFH
ncbi:hypothetical protein E6C70_04255 [Glaciibacter flavus]|uniref:Uncharacterized protein n=1 Tax=Orlajensenia flava TaxID=2565934 RepID=A0A4S4FWD4_9MICO|nr:hypothetical protein [Glaciibacter flavus]THG35280.1 hypothetical protein E6C70_04255 [Glaciibacter flavus]